MQAVCLVSPFNVQVTTLPLPTILEPDDALVRVHFAGLCGSDLHAFRGLELFSKSYVMGHEFLGEIVALGPAYDDPARLKRPALYPTLKVGDRIISPFTSSCAECNFCRIGLSSRYVESKLFGSLALPGAQAQYVRVPKAGGTLFLVPRLPTTRGVILDESLLLLGDVLPTGYFAALQALRHPNLQTLISPDHTPFPGSWTLATSVQRSDPPTELSDDDKVITCAVVGLGPVGICAIVSLLDMLDSPQHKYKVLAIDPNQARRAKGERILAKLGHNGDPAVLVVSPDEALGALKQLNLPFGCHAVLEVVGNNAALQLSYMLIRPFGVISSVGVHTNPVFPVTGDELYTKNVSLSFGRCPVRALHPYSLDVLVRHQDIFGSVGGDAGLIDKVVGMHEEEVKAVYADFEAGRVGKCLLAPWGLTGDTLEL